MRTSRPSSPAVSIGNAGGSVAAVVVVRIVVDTPPPLVLHFFSLIGATVNRAAVCVCVL